MEVNEYKKFLDVSGNIKNEDFYIGTILFNELYRKKFLEEFYKKFTELKKYDAKGTTLKPSRLKEVITFLNEKKIYMTCVCFTKQKINDNEILIKNKIKTLTGKDRPLSFFIEKIAGVLYYYALRCQAKKNYCYDGAVCMESQIKIATVLNELHKISKRDRYHFKLYPTLRTSEHMLKFADYVASAGRKIDWTYLDSLKYFELIRPDIDDFDLNHAFRIQKLIDIQKKKTNSSSTTKKFIKLN